MQVSVNEQGLLLPLDVAANARDLIFVDGSIGEDGVDGCAEVLASYGNVVAGTAAVELAPVHKFLSGVEEEEVRRAGCCIGSGDGLRFVVAVREVEAEGVGLFAEAIGRVGRVGDSIVGRDGDDANWFAGVVVAEFSEFTLDLLHVGAVGADKHHQERFFFGVIGELDGLSGNDAGQFESGRRCSQGEHGGFGVCHRSAYKARITGIPDAGRWSLWRTRYQKSGFKTRR